MPAQIKHRRAAPRSMAGWPTITALVLTLVMLLPGWALAANCLNKPLANGNVCITSFRTEPIGGNNQEMTASAAYQSTQIGVSQWNIIFSTTGPNGAVIDGSQITQGASPSGSAQQNVSYKPGVSGPPYFVKVQACSTLNVPPAPVTSCSDWATASFTPPAPPTGTCPKGQVANNGKCVTPPPPPCTKGQVVKNGKCVTPPPPPPSAGQSGSGGAKPGSTPLLKSNKAP
jgi:hypothetical protein